MYKHITFVSCSNRFFTLLNAFVFETFVYAVDWNKKTSDLHIDS